MTSFLEVDAANETLTRTASRKTVVAAKARVDERCGDFLRQATVEDFEARLALVQEDIETIVAEAAIEFEGGALEQYLKTIIDSFRPATPKMASVHESRKIKMCPFHKDVVDISLAADEAKAGFDSMAQHWGGPRHCDGEGYEGGKCNFKAPMVTKAFWDERAEKAEQRKLDRAEQVELDAQQAEENLNEGITEVDHVEPVDIGDEINEPVADNVVDVDFGGESEAPAEEIPMSMAASKESDYKYVKQEGDKWVITQKGTGKVLSTHDSEDKAKSAFRAMEMNMHGGSVKEADGGPVPVMDKRKWTPQTVPFLDNVDDAKGDNPTKHKDIVEPIKPTNGPRFEPTKLEEIGEARTERQDPGKEVDYAKTEGQSATWTKGPATAVSSVLPNDTHVNPIVELALNNYDGFLPAHTVQQAIAASRR